MSCCVEVKLYSTIVHVHVHCRCTICNGTHTCTCRFALVHSLLPVHCIIPVEVLLFCVRCFHEIRRHGMLPSRIGNVCGWMHVYLWLYSALCLYRPDIQSHSHTHIIVLLVCLHELCVHTHTCAHTQRYVYTLYRVHSICVWLLVFTNNSFASLHKHRRM